MAKAKDVAEYLLWIQGDGKECEEFITPLKLQKLLYYCQGFSLAINSKALFPEMIYAWDHGPVVPTIYHDYKANGAGPIPQPVDFNLKRLSKQEKELIDMVWNVFKKYSALALREFTHHEPPWKNAKKNGLISKGSMREYFLTQIDG